MSQEQSVLETLELVTKQMAVAVTHCNRDCCRYLWASEGYADWLQRPLDEIVGRPIVEVLGKEAFEALRHRFERVLSGEKVSYEEEVNYRSIGKRWISASYTPTFDAVGVANGWVAVIVDITERKQAEESLLWRLEFEGLLSDLSRTFISLPEEQIDANMERGLARLGEFLKLDRITLFEFSPDRTALAATYAWNAPGVRKSPPLVAINDLPWWRDRVLRGEVSLASQLNDLSEEACAEREFFRQRGIVSAASIPLKVGGEINGAISFVTVHRRVSWTEDLVKQLRVIGDIFWNALKRKRGMEALLAAQAIVRESEARFRLVANTAPVMIWISDPDKLCTYFNQRWLEFTGRPLEAELGNGWAQGVHPEDLERCLGTYTKAFDRRESYQMQYRLRQHDGEYRWILVSGVPRYDVGGAFTGYIGSAIDVTERKLAGEALATVSQKLIEAHEKERTRIARELHDDINQRLAVLAVNLEQLREDLPAHQTELRQRVANESTRVSELASDIQALSHRLHSSKLDYLGLEAAARGFCSEVARLEQVQIDFQSEGVPKELSEEISLSLFRVLQEALRNALKHSGSRHFQVSLRGGANEIELTVRDRGAGFKLKDAIKGHGLGLTSMQERLKLVNGQLSIDSKLQQGTTVHARVPLSPRGMSVGAIA